MNLSPTLDGQSTIVGLWHDCREKGCPPVVLASNVEVRLGISQFRDRGPQDELIHDDSAMEVLDVRYSAMLSNTGFSSHMSLNRARPVRLNGAGALVLVLDLRHSLLSPFLCRLYRMLTFYRLWI